MTPRKNDGNKGSMNDGGRSGGHGARGDSSIKLETSDIIVTADPIVTPGKENPKRNSYSRQLTARKSSLKVERFASSSPLSYLKEEPQPQKLRLKIT